MKYFKDQKAINQNPCREVFLNSKTQRGTHINTLPKSSNFKDCRIIKSDGGGTIGEFRLFECSVILETPSDAYDRAMGVLDNG